MSKTKKAIENLNTAKLILCNQQMLTPEMCIRIGQAVTDAITLLKEDCHNCKLECLLQKYDDLKEKYDALLKEQEAIAPSICGSKDDELGCWRYLCGKCKKPIDYKDRFCKRCGQKVKWDEQQKRSVTWT